MKKEYLKPTMDVVELQHKCQILSGSVKTLGGNTDFELVSDDTGYSGFIR